MVKCKYCGASIDVLVDFCPECGANNDMSDTGYEYGGHTREDTNLSSDMYIKRDSNSIAIWSYFGLLFIIPLLKSRDSDYIRFHVNQGIVLTIFNTICNIATYYFIKLSESYMNQLQGVTDSSNKFMVTLYGCIAGVIFITSFICWIVPLVGAFNGMRRRTPLIGGIKLIK